MSPALPYAATKLLEMAEIAQQSLHIYLFALCLLLMLDSLA